jgi:hypothetical protein
MIIGLDKIIKERPNLIKDMKDGFSGYAVPWSCHILKNGDVYLNGMYTIDGDRPHGTAELKITRTSKGYDLDFTSVDGFDSFLDTLEDCYKGCVGSKKEDWIKVGNVTEEYQRSLIT